MFDLLDIYLYFSGSNARQMRAPPSLLVCNTSVLSLAIVIGSDIFGVFVAIEVLRKL